MIFTYNAIFKNIILYFLIAHQISVNLDKLLFLLAQPALLAVCITLFSTFPHHIIKRLIWNLNYTEQNPIFSKME